MLSVALAGLLAQQVGRGLHRPGVTPTCLAQTDQDAAGERESKQNAEE